MYLRLVRFGAALLSGATERLVAFLEADTVVAFDNEAAISESISAIQVSKQTNTRIGRSGAERPSSGSITALSLLDSAMGNDSLWRRNNTKVLRQGALSKVG